MHENPARVFIARFEMLGCATLHLLWEMGWQFESYSPSHRRTLGAWLSGAILMNSESCPAGEASAKQDGLYFE